MYSLQDAISRRLGTDDRTPVSKEKPADGDAPAGTHAPCRNRTYNLLIKSQLLCQLS